MAKGKTVIAAATVAAVSLFALVGTSQAVTAGAIFTETTDAGQTLPTADATGAINVPLGEIVGTFNGTNDADLYVIDITNPATFSASTNNTATNTGGQDTALFLFSSTGTAIATNDDAAGGLTTDSTLPVGNALYANLSPGTYYLGISESGNEPVNTANQLLFLPYPGGDSTAVRGAASGLNPTTEANFNSNSFGGGSGAYEIDLTSTDTANAIPEPSTWAVVAASIAALGFLRRRVA